VAYDRLGVTDGGADGNTQRRTHLEGEIACDATIVDDSDAGVVPGATDCLRKLWRKERARETLVLALKAAPDFEVTRTELIRMDDFDIHPTGKRRRGALVNVESLPRLEGSTVRTRQMLARLQLHLKCRTSS
jgi:hypothetical protein